MAAAMKTFLPLLVLVVVLVTTTTPSEAQSTCASLSNLNSCTPFILPGATAPNADCCNALQSGDHDCICNMIRIAAQVPARCNLPPLSCPAN